MNTVCYLCETDLSKNDYVCCKMKCDHVLCQSCFKQKIMGDTFICQICDAITENVISQVGNNVIKSTPIKIGQCEIDEHYDSWMKIWNDLIKENKN
jgi:hypothetical protein